MRHNSKLRVIPASEDSSNREANFENLDFAVERLPLVPPGNYEVICLGCRKLNKFNRAVLLFTFKIVSQGQWLDTVIPTYINYPIIKSGVGKSGKLPDKSKLAEWLRVIQGFDLPNMNPLKTGVVKLGLNVFSHYQFEAVVETVTMNHEKKPLPQHAHSSKVANLIGIVGRISS